MDHPLVAASPRLPLAAPQKALAEKPAAREAADAR